MNKKALVRLRKVASTGNKSPILLAKLKKGYESLPHNKKAAYLNLLEKMSIQYKNK
jgi:hypothetical protein